MRLSALPTLLCRKANMEIGIAFVDQISHTVPVENSIRIKTRSVMGTEIPLVEYDKKSRQYSYLRLLQHQAVPGRGQSRLRACKRAVHPALHDRKCSNPSCHQHQETQKRANALKNITIPRYETLTRDITNALEEKEREEFTRLKVIKRMKQGG